MANYIKVTEAVAKHLGLDGIRNRTADGNYLLWQADVLRFPGDGLLQKAAYCGGVVLTPNAAKEEIDVVPIPVRVTVPEWITPEVIDKTTDAVPGTSPDEVADKSEEATV